jgi:hypothetical protein
MQYKLEIIDTSDYIGRWQARRIFPHLSDILVTTVEIESKQEFIDKLNEFIADGTQFERLVFRTHGNTGRIYLGKNGIWPTDWHLLAGQINFSALFPGETKVYFDGCLAAEGEVGDQFLTKAGENLLRAGGGSTSGWETLGWGAPGVIPFIGGHTVRLPTDDSLKTFYFKPGGIKTEKNDDD